MERNVGCEINDFWINPLNSDADPETGQNLDRMIRMDTQNISDHRQHQQLLQHQQQTKARSALETAGKHNNVDGSQVSCLTSFFFFIIAQRQ